jgi:hypothetical protein
VANLDEFAKRMRGLGDRVERRATAVQRKCAGAILQAVVTSTPVGNTSVWLEPEKARAGYVGGRARANWQVSVGGPKGGIIESVDASGGSTIAAGQTAINSSAPKQPIHLVNNLPYIIPLNNGHSQQAPVGFIQTAIQVGVNAVRGDKLTEGQ